MNACTAYAKTPRLVLAQILAVILIALPMLLGSAQRADAAAFTWSVYAPDDKSGWQMQAWANLSRDCSGTLGCYNYMKIERKAWWGNEFIVGNWVNNHGWNSMWATKRSGCHQYRTTIDSYNRYLGPVGGGVNGKIIGFNAQGQALYEYRTTWSSGWKTICTW